MAKASKWLLVAQFDGEPKVTDFRLEEEEIPHLQDGEFLCEALYLSVDPYMRAFTFRLNSVMSGEQVARVTESKNKDYPVGSVVQLCCGWRTKTVINPNRVPENLDLKRVPDVGQREPSIALGLLGMTGLTAYVGFLGVCQARRRETVLVNSAAGAVGSVVGQIAKIKGCKVIGFTGTKEKCDWLKSLGFNHVFNYKETDVDDALKQAAPDGVDCFFDNVGGDFTSKALKHMATSGRITVCGSISTYNKSQQPNLPFPFATILEKHLIVEGFEIYLDKWAPWIPEAKEQLLKWLNEGKIKNKETIREGFEKMPETFIALLKGENIGKMIVKM